MTNIEETPANYFKTNESGTLIGFSEYGINANLTKLRFPSTINGIKIREIGEDSFMHCTNLKACHLKPHIAHG